MNFRWLYKNIKIGKWEIPLVIFVWFLLSAITLFSEVIRGIGSINNYLVYKGVYEHLLSKQNLYLAYPKEYSDLNHYGPVFGILIAPFVHLSLFIGCFCWGMFNAWILYFAISKLPFPAKTIQIILLICLVELMTSLHNVQYNPMVAALIILSYLYVKEEKDWLATLCIALGFLTKIYPIVGLFFFLFSKHKLKFIIWGIFWMAFLMVLPIIITSPHFLYQTYFDWWQSLVDKTNQNLQCSVVGGMQDISVMGMIRRMGKDYNLKSIWVTFPAMVLLLIPLMHIKHYFNKRYQMLYLSCLLITTVIFSSSAESPTYIIAIAGVAVWWVNQVAPITNLQKFLLAFAIILTSLSATDLFPPFIKTTYIVPYSLKALPCFFVWLTIVYQLICFNNQPQKEA